MLDINDKPPVFSRTEYSARIDPSDPVGTTVVTVQATDLDAPGTKNSKVTYHMTTGGGQDFRTHFEVEEETGAVKTVSGLGCDRRRRTASGSGDRCLECVRDPSSPCWMTIEAKDSGDPIHSTGSFLCVSRETRFC